MINCSFWCLISKNELVIMNTGGTAEKDYRTTPTTFLGCSAKQLDKASSREIWSKTFNWNACSRLSQEADLIAVSRSSRLFPCLKVRASMCRCAAQWIIKSRELWFWRTSWKMPSTPALRERSPHILTNNVSKSLFWKLNSEMYIRMNFDNLLNAFRFLPRTLTWTPRGISHLCLQE